jgi:hypothetical protein
MSAVILLLTVGGWLIYSALKGQSLVESLTGKGGDSLDPAGGSMDITSTGTSYTTPDDPTGSEAHPSSGTTSKRGFKGPNAALLESLANVAVNNYHLTISQICRPADATYGAPNSLHKSCRAFDSTGSVADRVAFAKYARSVPGVDEVFCDQAGMIAPGYDHSDHVHVGA